MTFGEKLQDLRRQAGMSQETLAERLEVSRQAVSKWERDEAMPETEKVIRIARVFDVSLDKLLLDSDARNEKQMPQSIAYTDLKRVVRRHGYKVGYALMIWGLVFCVLSLLMWLTLPKIGAEVTGSARADSSSEFVNPYEGKTYTVIEGGEERVITEIPEFMIERARREQGVQPVSDGVNSILEDKLRVLSSMFLLGLVPGGALVAVGAVIVVKGKRQAMGSGSAPGSPSGRAGTA